VGQTYTNFMDPDAFPDTLDAEGPNAMVNLRNPQVGYGVELGRSTSLYFAVEKASSEVGSTVNQSTVQPNSPSPDGAIRLRQESRSGHWQVASIFRSIAGHLPNGDTASVFGWGVNAAGVRRIFRRDNVIVEGTCGHGIARYIQDTSGLRIEAAIISKTDPHYLEAVPELGPSPPIRRRTRRISPARLSTRATLALQISLDPVRAPASVLIFFMDGRSSGRETPAMRRGFK
jgi:hypothetical protein